MKTRTTITITEKQKKYIQKKNINLSKLVQNVVESMMDNNIIDEAILADIKHKIVESEEAYIDKEDRFYLSKEDKMHYQIFADGSERLISKATFYRLKKETVIA